MSDAPSTEQPTELSEQQFADKVEGLLDPKPQPRQPKAPPAEPQAQSSDATPEGTPESAAPEDAGPDTAPGDEEEEQPDTDPGEESEDAAHPIDPPRSWSNQEKELFSQLPPEAQQVIARREGERDKAFNQKTQEIAEHRKALESTFGEIQSERQSYAQNLDRLLFVAAPEAQQFAQLDWQRLAVENPAQYVAMTAQRDALRGRLGAIQEELGRVSQAAQQDRARQFAVLRDAEQQRLIEKLPAFGEPEAGQKLAGDMRSWLVKQGFSEQEIGQVIDHRIILVAEKAMRADLQRAQRQQAEGKRTPTAVPAVLPPGAPRQRSDSAAGQRRQQKLGRLEKSGNEQDAIAYLMEIL